MCQLLALNSNVPTTINFAFGGFAARGGDTDEHRDGFGIGFHAGRAAWRVFKDETPAATSRLAAWLRRHPLRATTTLAHIRKATHGAVQRSNCHPFSRLWRGRSWLFCHNGQLEGFRPELATGWQAAGHTDSEAAFCWLLQTLDARLPAGTAPDVPTLRPLLQELADTLSRHGPFNFLLSDGHALYAHCSTRLHWLARGEQAHPYGPVQLIDTGERADLSTAHTADERSVLVATTPLTHEEPWQALRPGELQVFVGGRPVPAQRLAS